MGIARQQILVLEREPDLAEVISSYLVDLGFQCYVCENPNLVPHQIFESEKRALVLDWDSFQKDYSTWLELFKEFPKNTPCVWLFSNHEQINSCPSLFAMQVTLAKPFELEKIAQFLSGQ